MPYIQQEQRKKWEKLIDEITSIINKLPDDKKEGDINYLITSILKKSYSPGYFNYNRLVGVLECIKLEMYRRVIGPYEDEKIKENGDVN